MPGPSAPPRSTCAIASPWGPAGPRIRLQGPYRGTVVGPHTGLLVAPSGRNNRHGGRGAGFPVPPATNWNTLRAARHASLPRPRLPTRLPVSGARSGVPRQAPRHFPNGAGRRRLSFTKPAEGRNAALSGVGPPPSMVRPPLHSFATLRGRTTAWRRASSPAALGGGRAGSAGTAAVP